MEIFFDTSAIAPLIFREPHSVQARKIWEASTLRMGVFAGGSRVGPLPPPGGCGGLRAADAGHLYLMELCSAGIPDIVLATFDSDMASAARRRGLRVTGDF